MLANSNGFTTKEVAIIFGGLFAFAVAGWLWYQYAQDDTDTSKISSFEECVEAGHPVMESYPRQCRAPSGEVFAEHIEEDQVFGATEYISEGGVPITINEPLTSTSLTSPLTISGEVPGTWSFEGDFPIELRNVDGELVTSAPAMIQGDWMTEDYVPFEATLEFSDDELADGALVLIKDNPTGRADLDDRLEIPINRL